MTRASASDSTERGKRLRNWWRSTYIAVKTGPAPTKRKYGQQVLPGVLVQRLLTCAVKKATIFSGCNSRPARVAPAGSNRSGGGGNESAEALRCEDCLGQFGEQAGRNASER